MEHIDWTYTNGNGHIDQHEFNECGKPYLDATLLGSGHCFNPSSGQNYEPTLWEEICQLSYFGNSARATQIILLYSVPK